MPDRKRCPKCKVPKSTKEFSKCVSRYDGLQPYCTKCRREYDKINQRKYRADPAKKDKFREYDLKKRFGITLDDYNCMMDEQDGKCAICGAIYGDNFGNPLTVDHCHKWGHIRGLLCRNCNYGLGNFDDNVEYLHNAIRYLNETGKKALKEAVNNLEGSITD